jgi:hypothetical protein
MAVTTAPGYLILHGEYVLLRTVVAFCPDVVAGLSIDKLCNHPHAITAAAHAAF